MLLHGDYGKLPGEVNEEIRKLAIGDEAPITCRPADLLSNEMDSLRESVKDIAKSEEDVLLCALFPQVAPGFLKKRDGVQEVKEVTVDWVD